MTTPSSKMNPKNSPPLNALPAIASGPTLPEVSLVSAPELSFNERHNSLNERIRRGDGNHRQAMTYLTQATSLERLAGQYQAQAAAIKAAGGARSGIRLSHIAHATTRALRDRDRYLKMAEDALNAPSPQ